MMRKQLFGVAMALIGVVVAGVGVAQAAPLAVVNPSFEDTVLADAAANYTNPITGWTKAGAVNAWDIGEYNPPASAPNQATNGNNVLYNNTGSVTQTLAATVAAGVYTLTVDVGTNAAAVNTTNYNVQLLMNGSPVGVATLPSLSANSWQVAQVMATVLPGSPLIGGTLGIKLISGAPQAQFDSVALDYLVPEPASLLLLSIGSLFVARRRRA